MTGDSHAFRKMETQLELEVTEATLSLLVQEPIRQPTICQALAQPSKRPYVKAHFIKGVTSLHYSQSFDPKTMGKLGNWRKYADSTQQNPDFL